MNATRLYLIRHGQVKGHEEKRYNGQSNVPLTSLGQEQSDRVCDFMSQVQLDAVFSSDLDRSLYCAELIASAHDLEVVARESFREVNIGDWQGMTWAELKETHPQDWQARLEDLVNFRVPNGESLKDAAERIRPALQEAISANRGGCLALVAHGGVNRIVLLDAIGADLSRVFSIEQDFGCINMIDYIDNGQSVVRLLNGRSHLTVPVVNG